MKTSRKNIKTATKPEKTTRIAWFNPPAPDTYTQPWMITVGITQDGDIYLPAICIDDDENRAIMAASWHGDVELVYYLNHAYLPYNWIFNNYPEQRTKMRKLYSLIMEKIKV